MSQIESQVTKIGNGAHVLVPRQWIGKKVRVILMEKED
jgi:putative transposon-encoded protein